MHLTNKEILDKLLSYSEDLKHHYNVYQLLLFHFQNKESEMPLDFRTLKTSKKDFYRSEYQKRKDKICPFSSLAFLQPTTVEKEPRLLIT